MSLAAVDKVLKDPILLRLFRIPSDLWPAMRVSWGLSAEKRMISPTLDYYEYKHEDNYKI